MLKDIHRCMNWIMLISPPWLRRCHRESDLGALHQWFRVWLTGWSTCRSTFRQKILNRWLLGIEGTRFKKDILLSQRKYILDLLSETEMLECRSIDSLMNVNTKMLPNQGELLKDARRYKRLVELSNSDQTEHHIAVNVVSQFLSAMRTTHLKTVMRILRYLKKAP